MRDKIMNITIRTIISAAFFLLSTSPLSAQEIKEEAPKQILFTNVNELEARRDC
jgi:hypothetical protein